VRYHRHRRGSPGLAEVAEGLKPLPLGAENRRHPWWCRQHRNRNRAFGNTGERIRAIAPILLRPRNRMHPSTRAPRWDPNHSPQPWRSSPSTRNQSLEPITKKRSSLQMPARRAATSRWHQAQTLLTSRSRPAIVDRSECDRFKLKQSDNKHGQIGQVKTQSGWKNERRPARGSGHSRRSTHRRRG